MDVMFSLICFFKGKITLCCQSQCLSVRTCTSVFPSSVEITLERGYTISTWPIPFKFSLDFDIGVMHV